MKKEDLRPVKISVIPRKVLDDRPDNGNSKTMNGFFHLWVKSVSESGDERYMALIELEDGKLGHYDTHEFSFSDR